MTRVFLSRRHYLLAAMRLASLLGLSLVIVFSRAVASSAQSADGDGSIRHATHVAPNPKVALVSGTTGRLDWTMIGLRLPRHSANEPCIQVASSVKGSEGFLQGQTSCGVISASRARPLGSISTSRRTHTSVLGLAFGLNVRKLRLEKDNGSIRKLSPLRLDQEKSHVLGLRPFAYVAIVSRGDHCYRKIVGLSRNDEKVFELHGESCP